MKILISAAEASSDIHGAQLLQALRKAAGRDGIEVAAFGIGGPRLQAEGLRAVVDARELLAMGFTELAGRLPRIIRALRALEREAARERPDLAVVVDYPDFHLRLARRLQGLGFPVVYYIPPKVWAWRTGRVRLLKKRFARILSILPFEEAFYRGHGVAVDYVGNPLLDELPLQLTRSDARAKLGMGETERVLVLMPGSRPAELQHHLRLMLESARLVAARLRHEGELAGTQRLVILMPLPVTGELGAVMAACEGWMEKTRGAVSLLDLRLSQGDSAICLRAADVGLIKSGTSTLEAGMLGCPHAIVYQSNALSHFVFEKLIRRGYPDPIGLVNLVLQGLGSNRPPLIREYIHKGVRPEELAAELGDLLLDPRRRGEVIEGLHELRTRMMGDAVGSPSERAAAQLLALVRK